MAIEPIVTSFHFVVRLTSSGFTACMVDEFGNPWPNGGLHVDEALLCFEGTSRTGAAEAIRECLRSAEAHIDGRVVDCIEKNTDSHKEG